MTTTIPPKTTEKKILRTCGQLIILGTFFRGIDSENSYFSNAKYLHYRAFKIKRGDTNFSVTYEWSKSLPTLSVCYN